MKTHKKYRYEYWLQGKICLTTSTASINEDNKLDLPIRVTWDEIVPEDINKIKEKQIEIFNAAVNEQLKIRQDEFLIRHSQSEFPEIMLQNELNKFLEILIDPMPKNINDINRKGIFFTPFSLETIKNYFKKIIIGGESFDYDLIHSNKCIHQNSIINKDIIDAAIYCRYAIWLDAYAKAEINIDDNTTQSNKKVESVDKLNLYRSDIFKNKQASNFFMELKEDLVKKGMELSNYSFIYKSLKFNTNQAILATVKHKYFITSFLNPDHFANIQAKKLRNTKTKKQQESFDKIYEKYKNLI